MGDVDISAEAVERFCYDMEAVANRLDAAGRAGSARMLIDAQALVRTLSARITELESLNATRNQQNAAALAEIGKLRHDAERYRYIKAHAAVVFDDEIRWTTSDGKTIFTHSAAQHELDLITDAALAPQSQQPEREG